MIREALAAVLRTGDLDVPCARPPQHEAEAAALRELMATLAHTPEEVLRRMVEVAMARCGAGSAALTVVETDLEGETVLRWWVTAGAIRPLEGKVMRHDESACGLTLDLGTTQLLKRPALAFPATAEIRPPVGWLLCAPFFHEGKAIGTLWVVRHDEAVPFDGEDRRLLESLTGFASLVWDVRRADQRLREGKAAQEALNEALLAERAKLLALVEHAPAFVAMLEGPELAFTYANDAYYRIVGHRPLIGLPLLVALPEIENQGWIALARAVMDTDEAYVNREVPIVFQREPGGPLTQVYIDFVLQPAYGLDGAVTGLHIHGVDITASVLGRRLLSGKNA